MVKVHKDDCARDCIDLQFLLDLTNLVGAQNDLILRNAAIHGGNESAMHMFCELSDVLIDIYGELYYDEKIDFSECQSQFIPDNVAIDIYEFLYKPMYNYRINCIFDGAEMFGMKQWQYIVDRTIDCYKTGIDTTAPQDTWICTGYSCDICRCEVSPFEYMWHCKDEQHKHDFCLSCVHHMVQQYYQMQTFLSDILDGVVNKDIIEEIVVLCWKSK